MLSEPDSLLPKKNVNSFVLILIVLEDALWEWNKYTKLEYGLVLILIVLEDALWVWVWWSDALICVVLILIVLEDALWEWMNELLTTKK